MIPFFSYYHLQRSQRVKIIIIIKNELFIYICILNTILMVAVQDVFDNLAANGC